MEPINQKILKHRDLYENAGLEVPPYRITGIEHRMLKSFLSCHDCDVNKDSGLIMIYCGVQLEHVMRLTDY